MLGWFRKRRGSRAMQQTREHAKKVEDALVELDNAIAGMMAGKKTQAMEAIKRLDINETAADSIEDDIFEEISKGDMDPSARGDLMRLIRRVDSAADWAKAGSRNLEILIETRARIKPILWMRFKEVTKLNVDSGRVLRQSLEALGVSDARVLRGRKEIDRFERQVDVLYYDLKKEMLRAVDDPKAMVVLNDFLTALENASDSCAAAAEMLFIMVVSGA
jgi:predicted phosphate transport protein (TIGR00153 family)